MKKTFVGLLAALSVLVSCSSNEPTNVVTPNARQLAWADAEVGVLIHFTNRTTISGNGERIRTHPFSTRQN